EDGIRDRNVTGVQTCALPICVADAARLHIDDDLSRPRIGDDDVGVFDWYSLAAGDDALDSLWHCVSFCLRRRVPADAGTRSGLKIGRASCRERVELSHV